MGHVLPNGFGRYINVFRPTECSAFCTYLTEESRRTQFFPIWILDQIRTVENPFYAIVENDLHMHPVQRSSIYHRMKFVHVAFPFINEAVQP